MDFRSVRLYCVFSASNAGVFCSTVYLLDCQLLAKKIELLKGYKIKEGDGRRDDSKERRDKERRKE